MNNRQFNQQTINKIYNLLKKNFNNEWADSFDNASDKSAWLLRNRDILETSNSWNKNFKIEDLLKSSKSSMESIYNTYSNLEDISPERLTQLTNAHNITKEEIKKYYDMRAEQAKAVQKYNEERWAEIDKARNEAQRFNEFYPEKELWYTVMTVPFAGIRADRPECRFMFGRYNYSDFSEDSPELSSWPFIVGGFHAPHNWLDYSPAQK